MATSPTDVISRLEKYLDSSEEVLQKLNGFNLANIRNKLSITDSAVLAYLQELKSRCPEKWSLFIQYIVPLENKSDWISMLQTPEERLAAEQEKKKTHDALLFQQKMQQEQARLRQEQEAKELKEREERARSERAAQEAAKRAKAIADKEARINELIRQTGW